MWEWLKKVLIGERCFKLMVLKEGLAVVDWVTTVGGIDEMLGIAVKRTNEIKCNCKRCKNNA